MCVVGGWVSYKKQELLTLPEYPGSSQFFHAAHLLVFCAICLCFVCLCSVSCS